MDDGRESVWTLLGVSTKLEFVGVAEEAPSIAAFASLEMLARVILTNYQT